MKYEKKRKNKKLLYFNNTYKIFPTWFLIKRVFFISILKNTIKIQKFNYLN